MSARTSLMLAVLVGVWLARPSAAATPYDFGNPSPQEEWMRQLINRARADGEAEADRYGLANTHPDDVPNGTYDVGEGMTITGVSNQRVYWSRYQGPRQVPAWSANLMAAARNHSDDMYAYSFFSHTTATSRHGYPGGSGPDDRAWVEGYPNHFVGENIATNNSYGVRQADYVHRAFFVDAGISGRGHRTNMLHSFWREVGVGTVTGPPNASGWTDYWTVDFASDAFQSDPGDPYPPIDTVYLTGVVFDDLDHDGAYRPGEQVPDVEVLATGPGGELKYCAVTAAGGGYSVPLTYPNGADLQAGDTVNVRFFDPAGKRVFRAAPTLQAGWVVWEDTASEQPTRWWQRLNIGLDVKAAQFSPVADGDVDLDGDVDFADYQALEAHFGVTAGATWHVGDFDNDGDVDFSDYQGLETNFGSSVPEPSALAMIVLALCPALRRRR